jgi:hypothetical protein
MASSQFSCVSVTSAHNPENGRMVGILSVSYVGQSASIELISEYVKSVSVRRRPMRQSLVVALTARPDLTER